MEYFEALTNRYKKVTAYLVKMADLFTNMGFDVYYSSYSGKSLESIEIVNAEDNTVTRIGFSDVPYRWTLPNKTIIVNGMVQEGGENYMENPFTDTEILESFHPMKGRRYNDTKPISTEKYLKDNWNLKPWTEKTENFEIDYK